MNAADNGSAASTGGVSTTATHTDGTADPLDDVTGGGAGQGSATASIALPTVANIAVTDVDRSEVLRYLGHRGQRVGDELAGRIDEAIACVLRLARPRAALRGFGIAARTTRGDGTPELRLSGSALVLAGTSIAGHLAAASEVAVMAVTLGMDVERELQRLSLAGNMLAQVLLDAAATAAIERAADGAEALVVAAATACGMGATWRFSPGYGDLPLDCQATLLASIDATRRLGLTLTASDLLVPTKSVTAVMGVGRHVDRGHRGSCATCNLRDHCTVRARGTTCRGKESDD